MRVRAASPPAIMAVALAASTCFSAGADPDASEPSSFEPVLPVGAVDVETEGGEWKRVRVELAVTSEAHARGLMFREELAEHEGMLFIFPRERIRSFWMKNTLIPLDMIFLDEDGRVAGIVHEAEPLTTKRRSVGVPSRYVLEVRGGWARAHGVQTGARVRFPGVEGQAAPFGG